MKIIIAGILALGLIALLVRRLLQERERKRREPERFFGEAAGVIEGRRFENIGGGGYPRLSGTYRGFPVQIHPVIDTLATRRLPALWLLVTLQDALPVKAKFDMMMRPNGATTFSNFDLLPNSIERPPGFPEQAVIRTDDPLHLLPPHVVEPHLPPFSGPRAKELLIAPTGLRIVWLIAEADRARYGVFRQAEFGEPVLSPALVRDLLDRLIAIRQSVLDWDRQVS